MKTGFLSFIVVLFSLASSLQAGESAGQVRDPFWPVGYRLVDGQTNVVVAIVAEGEKFIGPEEWNEAQAAIPKPSGIFIGEHPVSKEKVDKMLLGGKMYYVGDQICLTNEFVAFTWTIDSISFKVSKYELSPVIAERVSKDQ